YYVIVARSGAHLFMGDGEPSLNLRLRIGAAAPEAAFQLGPGRRSDEDEHRFGDGFLDCDAAPNFNLQHHIGAASPETLDRLTRSAVVVAVIGHVLQEE